MKSTDKLRELALAADKCGYDSWEHTQFKNEATPTAILELLDALKEIGDHIEARRALGCAGDFGGVKAILDKLCAS